MSFTVFWMFDETAWISNDLVYYSSNWIAAFKNSPLIVFFISSKKVFTKVFVTIADDPSRSLRKLSTYGMLFLQANASLVNMKDMDEENEEEAVSGRDAVHSYVIKIEALAQQILWINFRGDRRSATIPEQQEEEYSWPRI